MEKEYLEKMRKYEMLTELYGRKEFVELILLGFIDSGINTLCLEEDVDNEKVRDNLKARKILNDYLSGIMNEAKIMQEERNK